jgi:ABC-2 type transport system permease protein
MAPPVEATAGVIHDIGYRRYEGPRLGRGYVLRSLYGHGMRAAFGIGRGAKAKVFPWLVMGIVCAVALIVVAVRSISGQVFMTYIGFAGAMSFPVIMFLAVVAPELVSRDLRDGVLPLYFSRPLHRFDYAVTKLVALMSAVFLLLGGPQLFIYLGAVFSRDEGFAGAWRELHDLWPGLGSAAVRAVVLASLALLVASLTGRRALAAAGVAAVFLITTPVVGVLFAISGESDGRHLASLANPISLLQGTTQWLFTKDSEITGNYGPLYGVVAGALTLACVALLLARYRRVAQ